MSKSFDPVNQTTRAFGIHSYVSDKEWLLSLESRCGFQWDVPSLDAEIQLEEILTSHPHARYVIAR